MLIYSIAVAPPPPKQFTDEELKQQYGIHMATRLQSDENGKESKWADIDDDEEDWAPEAVVWMDGTKSTITPADAAPIEKEEQPVAPQPAKPAESAKPTLAVKRPSELGPQKTILKPGIAAQQAKQQNGAAATTPSTEKPSLKAKSPAPAPSKSPWASLPPIEAASPVIPPTQLSTQVPSLPTQDARAYDPQPPSQPAREIAADTFERSWREGEGVPRELFNSANGRYEPAPEGRRSSVKPDGQYRKPSVLQRPSQSGQSPAEPSAAFQTRSNSQSEGAPWPRRRGSSVSQGSIPPGRRMSVSKPPDLPTQHERERRPSTVVGHDMRGSPVSARNESGRPNFAQQSAWDQQMPPKPEPGTEAATEDPVKAQERIMREKREEAKRRRQEEEERQEKEKQERLKARLAALEGAGKSRKEREAEAAAVASHPPTSEKPTEPTPVADRPGVLKPAEASAEAAPALEAQSLPPPPETVAPQQQPTAAEQLPSPVPPQPQQPAGLPERPTAPEDPAQRQAPRGHLSPRANARAPFGQQPSPYRPPTSSYSSPGDRKQQPFGRSPLTNNDAFSGWNTTSPNGNVWGTSSGFGNGTFDKASSFAPVPMSQQNLPPPPGMGRPSPSSNRISPQPFGQEARSPSLQQQQMADQPRTFPPPGIESRPEVAWGQSRANGVSPAPGLGRQTHLPGPIAPPSRAQQQQQQPVQRPDPLSAWNNAATRLPHQYAADADAAERERERTQQEGAVVAAREDTIKETFKQTSAQQGKLGAPRRFDKTEFTVHDAQGSRSVSTLSPAPPSTQTQPVGPVPTASPLNEPRQHASENTVRIPDGSLNPAHGGLPMQQPPIGPPAAQQVPVAAYQGHVNFPTGPLSADSAVAQDQSPPPPETSSHPVFNIGDAHHPHVKLPPPPPRVKLPPGPTQVQPPMQQTPVMMPQRPVQVWGPPGVARPLVQSEDWQARFNGLFNRAPIQTEVPPSPPKTPPKVQGPALAIAASSRTVMDEMPAAVAATVSLPQSASMANTSSEGFTIDDSDDVVSKPTIEQMFNEELSFGSLPKIHVPRNPIYDVDPHHHSKYNMLKMGANSKIMRPVDARSGEEMTSKQNIFFYFHKHPQGFFVKLPGNNRLGHMLVKAPVAGNRKPSTMQERKVSGKFAGKGKEGKVGKDSGSISPATNGTPMTGSRQTSFQKAATPAPAASPAPNSGPANAGDAAGVEGGKKQARWAKPRGRNAPVKTSS